MRTTFTSTAVALSAAALTVGLAGATHADRYGIDDPRDTGHGSEIVALDVQFGDKNLHVATTHENLRRDPASGAGGRIYLDTDADDWGPEYVLVGGFFEGTDYSLLEADGYARANWGMPVTEGSYEMTLDYAKDTVHLRVSRDTMGNPSDVRVAVRASGSRTDGTSHGLVDWAGERRDTTPWIARG